MPEPKISGIAPFFIVKDVPAALAFYRDRFGLSNIELIGVIHHL
jgi:uncharacterized glyoxalase superfamily protein PhnB